jgi:hypothetical protein
MPYDLSVGVSQRVRAATLSDLQFAVDLAFERYSGTMEWGAANLGREAVRRETYNILSGADPRFLALRTDDSIVLAHVGEWFYAPGLKEVTVILYYGTAWGIIACLREVLAWACRIGAVKVKIDAETGIDVRPLLKRVGWEYKEHPGFTIHLGN